MLGHQTSFCSLGILLGKGMSGIVHALVEQRFILPANTAGILTGVCVSREFSNVIDRK